MAPDLGDSQLLAALLGNPSDTVARAEAFGRSLDMNDLVARDAGCGFAATAWRDCAAFGIQGLTIDPDFGGSGADAMTALLTFEGLGRGCPDNGLIFALASQVWTLQEAIARFGTDEQRSAYLPELVSGRMIGSFAMTEDHGGSDPAAITTTATAAGDGYVLNGTKVFITLGPVADVTLVFATTDPSRGRWGISAFLVDSSAPGALRGPVRPKTGMRTTPFGDLILKDCYVPGSQLLGRLGAGFSIFASVTELERVNLWAGQIGMMHRQLDDCINFAATRRVGGVAIGEHQSISHRIVDMRLRYETTRLLVYRAAIARIRGERSSLLASLTKLHAGESVVANSLDAVRIYGARGYVTEFEVERDLRDAVGGLTYSGTAEIQRNLVARSLGIGERR